jgi:inorganic pyrophosphatase
MMHAMTNASGASAALRAASRSLVAKRTTNASGAFSPVRSAGRLSSGFVRASRAVYAKYASEKVGEFPSMDFRMFIKDGDATVSAWHGVPLKNGDGTYNFICEIPKESKAKMEVATDEKLTPIKQDTKKGKLRDYPYNIHWNYGMLPQTWEDPKHEHPEMKVSGDNDPVDVVEIGSSALAMGSISPVKPVGIYAMIDDGELDWKVIAISTSDPKASEINDVEDVEKHFPGELEKIRVWFRDYKTPDGKPQNKFGLDDKCMNRAYTLAVIEETHDFYNNLKSGKRVNDEELSLE